MVPLGQEFGQGFVGMACLSQASARSLQGRVAGIIGSPAPHLRYQPCWGQLRAWLEECCLPEHRILDCQAFACGLGCLAAQRLGSKGK